MVDSPDSTLIMDGAARPSPPKTATGQGKALRRDRTGCLTCRQRHLKCDETKPICERCRKSRRKCVDTDSHSGNGRPRKNNVLHGGSVGGSGKRTNISPLGFKFVDETSKVASGYITSRVNGPSRPSPSSVLSSNVPRGRETLATPSLNADASRWTTDASMDGAMAVQTLHVVSDTTCSAREGDTTAPVSHNTSSPLVLPPNHPPLLSPSANGQGLPSSLDLSTFLTRDFQDGSDRPHRPSEPLTTTDTTLSPPNLPFSVQIYSLFDPILSSPEQPALDLSSLLDQVVSHQNEIERGYNEALEIALPRGDGERDGALDLGTSEREGRVTRRIPRGDRLMMRLMRHYVEVVGPWLDMTDSRRHFGTLIPERAFSYPVLLNAILAFSARHLSRLECMDGLIAEYYHSECVRDMIPMLQDRRGASSGELLAAMTILRMYEMLEPSGADLQHHLLGSCSLIGVESICEESDELRKAAFWVLLRQDILWAEKHRRPTIIDLSSCFLTSVDLHSPTSDEMWANRIYYLLAKVINFCFSRPNTTNDDKRREEWKDLEGAVEGWKESLPPGFQPFWYAEADEGETNPFPSVWLLSDWHVAGMQSYHMARFLLYTHCLAPLPSSGLSLGFTGLRFFQRLEEEILKHARLICGISVTNRCQSARISATQQLALAGKCLRSSRERQMLIQILREIEGETAWPVHAIVKGLLDDWGWTSEQG